MKVRELILLLQNEDPDAEVQIELSSDWKSIGGELLCGQPKAIWVEDMTASPVIIECQHVY